MAKASQPAEWLIVILPDGRVDSVEGGAPLAWLGRRLGHEETAPAPLRLAATALVAQPTSRSLVHRTRLSLTHAGEPVSVELLLLESGCGADIREPPALRNPGSLRRLPDPAAGAPGAADGTALPARRGSGA